MEMNEEKRMKEKVETIREFCIQHSDEKFIAKYARFFKTGYDAWGVDPILLKAELKQWLSAWQKEMALADVLALGSMLVKSKKYEEVNCAIILLAGFKKQFTADVFEQLSLWFEHDICNWAHTDMICSEIMKPLLKKHIIEIHHFELWRSSASSWKQRAIPVAFIQAVKNKAAIEPLLHIIEPMMLSPIREVQQGLGWFLREAWRLHPVEVELFLLKWKNFCGRIIIQYATEKMTKEEKFNYKKDK